MRFHPHLVLILGDFLFPVLENALLKQIYLEIGLFHHFNIPNARFLNNLWCNGCDYSFNPSKKFMMLPMMVLVISYSDKLLWIRADCLQGGYDAFKSLLFLLKSFSSGLCKMGLQCIVIPSGRFESILFKCKELGTVQSFSFLGLG